MLSLTIGLTENLLLECNDLFPSENLNLPYIVVMESIIDTHNNFKPMSKYHKHVTEIKMSSFIFTYL